MAALRYLKWIRAASAAALALALVAGCSGRGSVSGKVMYNGKTVTGGTITLIPLGEGTSNPGKAAAGEVGQDGTYTVPDGAVLGRNKVLYSAPVINMEGKTLKEGQPTPVSPYAGLSPKQAEVDIKSGSNTVDIELVRGVPGKQ